MDTIFCKKSLFSTRNRNWSYLWNGEHISGVSATTENYQTRRKNFPATSAIFLTLSITSWGTSSHSLESLSIANTHASFTDAEKSQVKLILHIIPRIHLPVDKGNLVDSPRSRLSGEMETDLLYSHANAAVIRRRVGPMATFSSVRVVNSTVTPPTVENEAKGNR